MLESRGMTPSVRMIIELNIKHYRELLKSEIDAVKPGRLPDCWRKKRPTGQADRPSQRERRLISAGPFPPVRRPHLNDLPCFRLDPSMQDASARKHQRVRAVRVEDSKLKVTVERRRRYRMPTEQGRSGIAPSPKFACKIRDALAQLAASCKHEPATLQLVVFLGSCFVNSIQCLRAAFARPMIAMAPHTLNFPRVPS